MADPKRRWTGPARGIEREIMSKLKKPVYDGELIKFDGENAVAKYDEKDFALATKAGDYLPRVQFMTSNSDKCKSGKFPINHYALVRGKDYQDLGDELDVLVVEWRPKAIEMGDSIITSFNPKSEEFARIQAKAGDTNSGCMYGPEFLVYIPSVKEWATLFMGSKSSRNESGNMRTRLQKAATLKGQELSNKNFTWYSISVVACSTPFSLPNTEEIVEQRNKFLNPSESEITTDSEESSRER